MQLGLFISLVVFVIDLFVPRGVCAGVMHILAVMATLTCSKRQQTLVVATVAMIFVLAADIFAPGPGETELWKIMFNQVLIVAAIWGTAFVIYLRGKAVDELEIVSKRLDKELDYASRLQQKLYPNASPRIEGIDVSGIVLPAERLCGDYYDFLEMPGGTHGFVIGDVSGHGVGQSLIMSEVRSALRSLVKSEHDLGTILSAVNRRLCEDAPDEIFVTLMIVRLDPETMTFAYATAGHSGLLFRASGEWEELRCESLALGLSPEAKYETQAELEFNVGDTLLLSTDGLEERHSPQNELFGRERLVSEVRGCGDCSSEQLIKQLIDAAGRFAKGLKPHDDVTLVAIKRIGPLAEVSKRPRKKKKSRGRVRSR